MFRQTFGMVEYWNSGRLGKEPGSPRKGPGFRGLKPIIPVFQHPGFQSIIPYFHYSKFKTSLSNNHLLVFCDRKSGDKGLIVYIKWLIFK